jgi:ribosome assembly protein RRB1
MSKRQADQNDLRDQNKSTAFGNGPSRYTQEKNEMGEFEDAWEDEIEEEEIVETNEDMEEDGKLLTKYVTVYSL